MTFKKLVPAPLRVLARKLESPTPRVLHSWTSRQVTGIAVQRYGRLGNNLIQLANALIYAELTRFQFVRVAPMPFLEINAPTDDGPLTLLPPNTKTSPYGRFIEADFYKSPSNDLAFMSQALRRQYLRKYVRPHMALPDPVPAPASELTIHLRSGDIFSTDPHPDLVQPPLAFYQLLIDRHLARTDGPTVKLVFEDRGNPCVSALETLCAERGLPVTLQSGTLEEDLAHLLGAQNVVFGSGSFGVAVTFLSDHLRHLNVFDAMGGYYSTFDHLDTMQHWQASPGSYIPAGGWANTEAQHRLMLDLPVEMIEPMDH